MHFFHTGNISLDVTKIRKCTFCINVHFINVYFANTEVLLLLLFLKFWMSLRLLMIQEEISEFYLSQNTKFPGKGTKIL